MQPRRQPTRLSRNMRFLLALLLAVGFAGASAGRAAACSCMTLGVDEAAAVADAVFAGTVVNHVPVGAETGPLGAMAATVPAPMPLGQMVYTFAVEGVAKGEVPAQVEVLAGGDGASCGFSFGMNERWLVFTTWDGAMHSTGLCSGNVALEQGADAPLPLTAPSELAEEPASAPAPIPMPVLIVLGTVAAVLAVSVLAFRRDRPS